MTRSVFRLDCLPMLALSYTSTLGVTMRQQPLLPCVDVVDRRQV